jgi:hypothetical protein
MHELLAPAAVPRDEFFDAEFAGMTQEPITRELLAATRARLLADVRRRLTGDIAAFLLSLQDAEPDFGLIGLPEATRLPAVRWKLANLEKLKRANPEKHAKQREALERLLV